MLFADDVVLVDETKVGLIRSSMEIDFRIKGV
jgi:hypothetical protein